MRIYDISQEIFSCEVYPGDPVPQKETVCSIEKGDLYNLTKLSMCAHNGTHLDAPSHFIKNGDNVESIPLEKTVGLAYVIKCEGELSRKDAEMMINKASAVDPECAKRILIKGNAVVSSSCAEYFAERGVYLLGVESQTVGPEDAPMEVHLILLRAKTVLLEGIRLGDVPEGKYFLFAAPLKLGGCDGAPVRAILMGDI